MARATIPVKLKIEADAQTARAIRAGLATDQAAGELAELIRTTTGAYLGTLADGEFTLQVEISVTPLGKRPGPRQGQPPPPVVSGDPPELVIYDHELDRVIDTIKVGGREWAAWLEIDGRSFRYESRAGTFTASKNRGRWYARRRIDGKLRKVYLGTAESVTARKLWEAAHRLSQLELPKE